MIGPVLLVVSCVHTFDQKRLLMNPRGLFFERDAQRFV